MEFLDPKKRRAHTVRLIIGYVLIGIAVVMATTILLYQAYGFGIDKHGQVIQNGLVFMSSKPAGTDIYVDGERYKSQTNTRMQLPTGQYEVKLQRAGYRDWLRTVTVNGGDVQHFDYPVMVPTNLSTTTVKPYAADPNLVSQSPDRRWLLVQNSANFGEFELYDLTKPKEPATALALPPEVLSASDAAQSWQELEWSNDNRHLLLKHMYQKAGQPVSEYVLLDRQAPTESLNLTKALNANPTEIALRDKAYDEYYLFDQTTATLTQATLKAPTPVPYLTQVLDFKPYGANTVLYVTGQSAPAGKVLVMLQQGNESHKIRELPAASDYLLDLARYSGDWYLVAGTVGQDKVYLYRNPIDTLKDKPKGPATPLRVLRAKAPNYVQFSDNAQFILVQGGATFAVYDAENKRSYNYELTTLLDAPQPHASWIDGHHLTYVSGGKTVLFDYDGINLQTLDATDARFGAFFDPDLQASYGFATVTTPATATKSASSSLALTTTPLLNSSER